MMRSHLTGGAYLRQVIAFTILCLSLASTLHAQQFRAAWADVFHVGMRSTSEVNTMISQLVAGRYNAVVVQVVAYMDNGSSSTHGAYWKSSILPWCGYVTAGFDPLAYLCQQAHANGIEVHAWLGGSGGAMYRASLLWPPPGNATLAAHPEWMMVPQANSEGNAVVPINGYYMLDMGSSDAQEYIVSIVRELVTNYEIDGINWDDEHGGTEYNLGLGFPAYSTATYTNSGLARYRRNTGYVGTPSATDATYGNYRRRFKNELIARCQAEIQSIKTNPRQPLRHTSAVMAFGGPPGSCTFTSEEAYTYYSDWPTMLQNGWLDAAIPMNYKVEFSQSFRDWCDRSYSCWRYSRHIYMGLGAYLAGNSKADVVTQLQYVFGSGLNGAVTYSYGVPYDPGSDTGDWWSYAAANIYTSTATPPTMPWRNPATATQGMMWGRVADASTGKYVDDATVTVSGRPAVKTDGNGYYVATLIPATAGGTIYSVTASKTGATSQTVSNATVLAGDIVRYDLFLNASTNAPVLTDVHVENVTDSTATIVWTTDQPSDSAVDYGPTAGYGFAVTNPTAVLNHTVNLSELSPNMTYHYRAKSKNAANQTGFSEGYVFTTLSASVSDLIVESRQADGALTPNPPYSDAGFLNSTLKSSAAPLTGSSIQGSRYATGGSGTPTFTITPTLAVAGGTYDVYQTHGSAPSISDDIVVAVSQSGCTGLPSTTTIFQEPGGNTWEYLGQMTLDSGVSVPALTFTYSSGALSGTSRMYSDAIKFVYVPPPPQGPAIVTHPQSRTNLQGSSAAFSVVASGTPLLYYQWWFNGTNIAGATDGSYTRTNVQPAHAGTYTVVVTNLVNAVTSAPATLTVIQPQPPHIDAITLLPDGRVHLTVSGSPGNYGIDRALNLSSVPIDWLELTNLFLTTNSFEYTDPQTNLPQRFYRAKRLLP